MTDNRALLCAELERDEGVRLKPYRDTVGKLTIGTGRNLDDIGISFAENRYLLMNDIDRVEAELDAFCSWWRALDLVRQRVLANMGFNMGVPTLCTFRTTLTLVRAGEYERAAQAMLQSKWAAQVGQRVVRLAQGMRSGQM